MSETCGICIYTSTYAITDINCEMGTEEDVKCRVSIEKAKKKFW